MPTSLRILFANIPADGHFNPLTRLAATLKQAGHDVRWYTGPTYAEKIASLGIPCYPFRRAREVTVHNIDEVFPERRKIKSHMKKVIFDICTYFIQRGEEFYEDIRDINREFDFDILVADCAFTGISYTRTLLHKEVIAVGVLPLSMSSVDIGPTLMGLAPPRGFWSRQLQRGLKALEERLLRQPTDLARRLHAKHGIDTGKLGVLDIQVSMCSLYLQNGAPGFEYHRSDLDRKIRFVGPLLPEQEKPFDMTSVLKKIRRYAKVLLVTQGTFEPDPTKLIIPVLEAYKQSDRLVVVTTAGFNTGMLRQKYPFDNIIIEDFIPFDMLMPHMDLFVSNGGYGGVIYSIVNGLPMVVAGVHEGKNEVCRRVEYFGLGVNMKTERPSSRRLKKAIEKVLSDGRYGKSVERLRGEFGRYNPEELCLKYISALGRNSIGAKESYSRPERHATVYEH